MLPLSALAPIFGFVSASLPAASAMADDETLQEVVVTAEKREENARDVPITMTVFNGAAIQAEGFTGLTDYAKFVPGLVYNGSGLGERSGPDIVIRGVANSRLFDFETNIGTNTTGFVYGEVQAYAFDPELIDVQRIEVLKGPQGTLYGASAMGGLVKVVPNLPEFNEFSGQFVGGVSALDSGWNGGGDGWKFSTVVNTPLSDVLALRFSFHSSVDPGYLNIHLMSGSPNDAYGPNGLVGYNSLQSNVYGAGEFLKDVNKSEDGGGRIALRFKPNDQFDATLAFMYDSKESDSLPNYEPALSTSQSPLTADQFQLQPTSTHYSLGSLEASYDFGPAVLHSITGWIERNHSSSVDFAGVTYGALGGNGTVPLPTPAPVTFAVGTRILSQEVRLQGNEKDLLWSGSALDWTVGGFYQREKRDAVGGGNRGLGLAHRGRSATDAAPQRHPDRLGRAVRRHLHQQGRIRRCHLAHHPAGVGLPRRAAFLAERGRDPHRLQRHIRQRAARGQFDDPGAGVGNQDHATRHGHLRGHR
jgi:outer membrane receptor protein involved in Fe transport